MSVITRLSVLRPADLLLLDLELVNLQPSDDGTTLVPVEAGRPVLLVVQLPPQAMAEAVWTGAVAPPPVRTVLSGPSRLVFRVPDGVVVPLAVEGLLAWEAWEPVLAPGALPRGTGGPGLPPPNLPAEHETAIELPWRLVLSPDGASTWRARSDADVVDPPQLWSAVLIRRDPAAVPLPDVRALGQFHGSEPLTSLDESTRGEIVQLSSNYAIPVPDDGGPGMYTPVPIEARHLELTALGADADLHGAWDSYPLLAPGDARPAGYQAFGLRDYQHTTALGRDHRVRTVKVGYLCGTGHQATIIETVERLPDGADVVEHQPGGALFGAKGYLRKTTQVFFQQQVVQYDTMSSAFAHGGRELPLRSIRITMRSATIQPPAGAPFPEGHFPNPFWLRTPDGALLTVQAVATDIADNQIGLELPLMFVPYEHLGHAGLIRAVFDDPAVSAARTIPLRNQTIVLAPAGDTPGATTATVESMRLELEQPPAVDNPHPEHTMRAEHAPPWYLPRFLPRFETVTASVPAVQDLLGTAPALPMRLDDTYLAHGFDPVDNRAQAFLAFAQPLPLGLSNQRGGGLAGTSSTASALSRTLGPVAAPDKLQAGTVDLSAFADTRLLGTIPLLDLLPLTLPFDAGQAAQAGQEPTKAQLDDPDFMVNPPRLTTRRSSGGAAEPDTVEARFLWKPPLRRGDAKTYGMLTVDVSKADLLLDARTTRGGEDNTDSSVVLGRLRHARLVFADALAVDIGELGFRAESGRKVDLGAKDVQIAFQGPLSFVNALQSILPSNGFDDPPYVTADSSGVVVGYTLGVPDIPVGIFSIQSIALSAALSIPFTGRPAGIRFAVCERHKPFLVTVSLFGGGGFFAVGMSASRLEQVEASLEFGGNISLNLGVASGGVDVMAGIYFGMTASSVELTGYLKCGGYLEVLGLISISLEFYLAFTYRNKDHAGSEVWGQASLSVSVEVAFFSTSVTLSVERRFAGSDGDPTFAQSVTPAAWAHYLQAFA